MSQGNLVKAPYSEITATLELLDRLGVTPEDLAALRKASSWQQLVTGCIMAGDPYLLALLSLEIPMKKAGFTARELAMLCDEDVLRTIRSGFSKGFPINRSTPFNPAEFIGKGWTIEEQDERSLALTELDLTKVQFTTMLLDNESSIRGEEKLARLKNEGHVRMDAKVLQTLWENNHLIPESWKEKTNGNTTFIFFDGTVLRDPNGDRYALCLFWSDGEWFWNCYWLDDDWYAYDPSAVLT